MAWIPVINVISQDVSKLSERRHDMLGVQRGVSRSQKQPGATLQHTSWEALLIFDASSDELTMFVGIFHRRRF